MALGRPEKRCRFIAPSQACRAVIGVVVVEAVSRNPSDDTEGREAMYDVSSQMDMGWSGAAGEPRPGRRAGGGAALGHPTPSVDRIAKEGAVFTSWYGQASCTAGRASFITGRIPIRSALSIV